MNAIPQRNAAWGLVSTRYVRPHVGIPADVRVHNINALRRTLAILRPRHVVAPEYRNLSDARSRVESLIHLERLWDQCETTFAAFDVVAADPVRDAYDTSIYLGGNYPKAPRARWSEIGSVAAMFADAAG